MYRYIEVSNAFCTQQREILVFVAGNIMKLTSTAPVYGMARPNTAALVQEQQRSRKINNDS